ncbi:MAG: DinB family protein [Planctomycetota bacterium]
MADSSNVIGHTISASTRLAMGYVDRLLFGVTADQFARFASCGGVTIESNHPCFILGHLSLYAPRVVKELGGEMAGIEPTVAFQDVFSKDAKCVDDPDANIYPPMDEVVDAFRAGHERAISVLEQTSDELFQADNPNEPMRPKFPTTGQMHAFYLGGHLMMHLGQFSGWRRSAGLGSA